MISLSPGVIQGCFDLLGRVARHPMTFSEIRSSFAYIGGLPTNRIVDTAQSLGWIRAAEAGMAVITPAGSRLSCLTKYEAALRQALLDYVDVERPAWIQNAIFGRRRIIAFCGTEIGQVFVEAGLSHGTEGEVVAFWDAIAARARGQKTDKLLAIGRRGEHLTLEYERTRTGHSPKWISVDDNADGYDVLSVVDADDPRPLSIEVKTSTIGLMGRFHLTRNEWDRSTEVEDHIFHLWDISTEDAPCIATLPAEKVGRHIPTDCGVGAWELVEIPFSAFEQYFLPSRI